ncbi:uncharacterized protein K441DRAFT_277582 [Cenococcum geophilum 1.58]|uniref:uncharacterized protein n=1 Tax=Cenococcum geophilum 1.58 TaxID=794803 RepID=UPI00358E62CA|nr:hypothetical protein K441DRAFT_277582 [Cenococcum geophilum 1.58]
MAGGSGVSQLILLKRQIVRRGFGYGIFTALGSYAPQAELFHTASASKVPSTRKLPPCVKPSMKPDSNNQLYKAPRAPRKIKKYFKK